MVTRALQPKARMLPLKMGLAIYQDVAPVNARLDRYYSLAEALNQSGTLRCALFRSTNSNTPLATSVAPGVRFLDLAYGFVGKALAIPELRRRRQHLYDPFVSWRWRLLKPDLVVCNYPAPYTRAALKGWKGRLVYLDKSCLELRKWSKSGDPAEDARLWRAGELPITNSRDRFRLGCDHVITMAEEDLPWYSAFGVRASLVPNAIDVTWWKEQAREYANEYASKAVCSADSTLPRKPLRWLGIGTDPSRKNLVLLLRAWERAAYPGHLTIVGVPDNQEWRERLRSYVSRAGDTLQIHFGKRAMAPHFGCADILVLPTRAEGAPRVVLEAACFGVPALTTLPGRGSFVEEGRTGWLIKPLTVDVLAQRMAALARSRAHVNVVGANAAFAIEDFDVSLYGTRIADAIVKTI